MNLEEIQRRLEIDGWCVIESVIPADEVDNIRTSILATVAEHKIADARKSLEKVSGVINFDQSFAPYLAEPRLLELCSALLGEHVRISFTTCMVTYPGNQRGTLHADWPFNQQNAGHIPAPYPDAVAHLTTIWMLTPFSPETGTLIVNGSHRNSNNPSGENGVPELEPYPTEIRVSGEAGSVLVMDSRLWHAISPNRSDHPRVALVIRYAPWWLNLDVLMPGSDERRRLVDETGGNDNAVPPVPVAVFEDLPEEVKPLFRHWVRT